MLFFVWFMGRAETNLDRGLMPPQQKHSSSGEVAHKPTTRLVKITGSVREIKLWAGRY
jgi:hypothetical protein